jgi:hypothetical protein
VDARRVEPVGPPVLEEPRISIDGAPAKRRRPRPDAPEEPPERSRADELVRAGSEEQPGRTIRLRDTR